MIIKQNKELKSSGKLTSELKHSLTEKQAQYQALAVKVDPTWTKFLEFCSLYRIEEEYATEERNINRTIYQEFPNCMGRFHDNLREKGTNEYRKFELKDNLIAYGFSEVEGGKYHFGQQISKVYDKWRSDLFVKVKF